MNVPLPPGGRADVDLSVGEGESLLVIKRKKDGSIVFPSPAFSEAKTGDEIKAAIVEVCKEILATSVTRGGTTH